MRSKLFFLFGLIFLTSGPISAAAAARRSANQQESTASKTSTPRFVVSTRLVLVPVVVTDRHGSHVADLKVGDFELKEDGNVQQIVSFENVEAETTVVQRPAPPANSFTNQVISERVKNLEIILLDYLNTPLSGRDEARRGLIDFLTKSAGPDTLLALLVLEPDGLHMIHSFTSDSSVLMAAIEKLRSPSASRDAPTLDTGGGDADAEAMELGAILDANKGPVWLHPMFSVHGAQATVDASRQGQESLRTLECLQQVARYFSAVRGRKSLIWMSSGFYFQTESLPRDATNTGLDDWQRTIRMLQDANIALYPVDVAGLSATTTGPADIEAHGGRVSDGSFQGAMASGRSGDPQGDKHRTMDTLAGVTGGEAFYNFNDSGKLLQRARQDSAQYYMMTYYAKAGARNGWRKLNVSVRREGVQVRARSGFFFETGSRDPDTTRKADEIRSLTSALESTSLPISGQWGQIETAGNKRRVHFSFNIPADADLISPEQPNDLDLDCVVVAWTPKGEQAANIAVRLSGHLSPATLGQLKAHGLDYDNELTLPPGTYEVHIVVRDNPTGRIGSIITTLKVD